MPDDTEDDRPRRPRRRSDDPDYDPDDYEDRTRDRDEDFNPAGLIVPLGASPFSIISCYTGLLGLCVPVLGVIALVTGILALRGRKKVAAANYGSVTSDIRAWVGIAFGIWGTIYTIGLVVWLIILAANGKL